MATCVDNNSVLLFGGPCAGQRYQCGQGEEIRTVYIDLRGPIPRLERATYEVLAETGVAVYVERDDNN